MIATRLDRSPPFERGITLGDFLVPIRVGERIGAGLRHLVLIILGALLIVGGAYASTKVAPIAIPGLYVPVPGTPVPFSLQTFAVLFTGATLGFRRGLASTGVYLLWGIVGLPVFALKSDGTRAGLNTIISSSEGHIVLGSTGGYLIGFLVAAAIAGALAEHGWDRNLRSSVAAMLVASAAIYAIGLPWLAIALKVDATQTLDWGLYPFIPGDVIKLLVAAGLLPVGWWFVRRRALDL